MDILIIKNVTVMTSSIHGAVAIINNAFNDVYVHFSFFFIQMSFCCVTIIHKIIIYSLTSLYITIMLQFLH